MASFTYAQMKTAVESWMEDAGTDFDGDFPTMLSLAEDRLLKDLDLTIFDVEQALTLNAATVAKLPAGLVIATREIFVPSIPRMLYPRTWGYIKIRHGAATGLPKDFADLDASTYLIGPAPAAPVAATALVTKRPNSLATDTTGTFLSTRAGDALFAAVLFEAALYQEKDGIAVFESTYQAKLTPARFELRGLRRRDYSPLAPQPSAAGKMER